MAVAIMAIEENSTDLGAWLTRNEALDLLRCSIQAIYAWEKEGRLHPRQRFRNGKGGSTTIVYDPRELVRLATIRIKRGTVAKPGELAARCFESFDQGKSIRELVVEMREQPSKIKALYQEWFELGGAERVITEAHKAELEKLIGSFETVSELVEAIARELTLAADGAPRDCSPDGAPAPARDVLVK